jgi:putative tricarboxylic transport membrane protein
MIWEGFLSAMAPVNILYAFLGTALGIVMGAIPGIGSSMTMALLLPFTFWMSPAGALILLGAVYCGATYGGSISAILLNTPGTPASAATSFDGYPMAQQGKGMAAIGIAAMASFVGGAAGLVLLFTVSPLLAEISLKFGPAELFLLTLFTFTIISVTVLKESVMKGLIALGLGLIFSGIGYDPISGALRFTFGLSYLEDGIQLVPAIIGLFAISEVFAFVEMGGTISNSLEAKGGLSDGFRATFRYPATLIRSTVIGSVIGALPGIGVSAANLIAYVAAKARSKHPELFGKGSPEGVIAPEASNNAVTCTSLIPTLTMGIPGSSSAALLMGALMIHGLIPGASLFTTYGEVTYTFFFGLALSNIFMLLLTVLTVRFLVKITVIDVGFLIPIIVSLCFIGSYAMRNNTGDAVVAMAFGVLAYVMRKLKYPLICLLLPIILGAMMERGYHQSLMISGGSFSIFWASPISKTILAITLLSLLYPLAGFFRKMSGNRR